MTVDVIPHPVTSAGVEIQRHAVDAVAQAGRRRAIFEHVSEVTAAAAAMDLGAGHEVAAIRRRGDRPFDRCEEARPAGAALEFPVGDEERLSTADARERAARASRAAARTFPDARSRARAARGTAPASAARATLLPISSTSKVFHRSELASSSLRRLLGDFEHVGGRQDHRQQPESFGSAHRREHARRSGSIWRTVRIPTIFPLVMKAGVRCRGVPAEYEKRARLLDDCADVAKRGRRRPSAHAAEPRQTTPGRACAGCRGVGQIDRHERLRRLVIGRMNARSRSSSRSDDRRGISRPSDSRIFRSVGSLTISTLSPCRRAGPSACSSSRRDRASRAT